MPKRKYIWCWISKDGKTISPIGDAKAYEQAMSCAERLYPYKFRLYELREVKRRCNHA